MVNVKSDIRNIFGVIFLRNRSSLTKSFEAPSRFFSYYLIFQDPNVMTNFFIVMQIGLIQKAKAIFFMDPLKLFSSANKPSQKLVASNYFRKVQIFLEYQNDLTEYELSFVQYNGIILQSCKNLQISGGQDKPKRRLFTTKLELNMQNQTISLG